LLSQVIDAADSVSGSGANITLDGSQGRGSKTVPAAKDKFPKKKMYAPRAGSLTGSSSAVDIESGPGALLLDNELQKLSTIEQTSAQNISNKNRTAKEINQTMR
jgi:hypothetical protein